MRMSDASHDPTSYPVWYESVPDHRWPLHREMSKVCFDISMDGWMGFGLLSSSLQLPFAALALPCLPPAAYHRLTMEDRDLHAKDVRLQVAFPVLLVRRAAAGARRYFVARSPQTRGLSFVPRFF
jgi:hypothetical protein